MNSAVLTGLGLPTLTGSEARARSLVARHGADVMWEVSSQDGSADSTSYTWRLGLSPGVPEALLGGVDVVARVDWAGAQIYLGVPSLAVDVWLASNYAGLDVAGLPEAMASAAIETMLAEVLGALNTSAVGARARVLATGGTELLTPGISHAWTLRVQSQTSGEAFYATLHVDNLGLMLLAGMLTKVNPVSNDLALDVVPILVRVDIGHTDLAISDLRALSLRDTVLIDHYRVNAQGELWLALNNGRGVRVGQRDSSFIVTEGWTKIMDENDTEASESEQAPDHALLEVDEIKVRMTFDLGERQIALGELRQLQAGETFDLGRPLAGEPVMIRVNGALIGQGELVEIDGRVGVTISSLGKQHHE